MVIGAVVEPFSGLRGKHPALLMPELGSSSAFGLLLPAMLSEQSHQLGWQADGAPPCARLHVPNGRADATPLGAVTRHEPTGISATVHVLGTQGSTPDPHDSLVQVDVAPLEAERLARPPPASPSRSLSAGPRSPDMDSDPQRGVAAELGADLDVRTAWPRHQVEESDCRECDRRSEYDQHPQ